MNHNRTKRLFAAVLATLALTVGFSGVVIASAPLASANGVALMTGDVLASVGSGLVDNYSPSGTLLDTLNIGDSSITYTTGGCFDSAGNFYVTDFDSNEISQFSPGGNLLNATWATDPSQPESCAVDAKNNVYVGGPGAATIYEYNSSGTQVNSFAVTGGSGTGGTDWLDIAADQCTILYTGEGSEILSYNVCTQTQNADFATGLPAPCYELRIRPNGDVMVACASEVLRYSSSGALLQTYPISTGLFSMNLDPDNATFWTGDAGTGEIYHVNIATGAILGQFNSSPTAGGLNGLTLVGAINVAQPTVTLAPPTATQVAGTTDTVTATITNPGGSISGQTVSFAVSGANTTSGTAVTNASGQATFSYTGANTGTDTVTATFLSGTGTASVTWTPPVAASTSVTTELVYGDGQTGTSIVVPAGSAVFDNATLAGPNATSAGGTVTYNVYSDAACTILANGGSPQTVSDGDVPESLPVTLSTPGTYYWQAVYSGDSANKGSSSTCGPKGEVETVKPGTTAISLATSLSGGGKSGTSISVTTGTGVTDIVTATGTAASSAMGAVTYNVYSDAACTQLVSAGSEEAITTAGTFPRSQVVTLSTPGTYYWQASYTGDATNAAATSPCAAGDAGDEVETVTPPVLATTLTTSLSGGGKTGTAITVPVGTAVTDAATLSGVNAAKATGTVTYKVYSDSACTKLVKGGTAQTIITAGMLPKSVAVTLTAAGKYFWTAAYSGDATNKPSASKCGAETVTLTPLPTFDTMTTAVGRSAATAKVTTTAAGDLLVALVAGRGPTTGGQTATVSGGGVTWHFIGRENAGRGDVEVWTATASGILSGVSVKATAKTAGFTVTMTVQAFKHATGTGAVAKATAARGVPKATLKTANNAAWVLAMADDWTHAVTPKPVTGQFVVSRVTDSTDTFWVQAVSQLVIKAGTLVTISDSTPTADPWDLIAIEVH